MIRSAAYGALTGAGEYTAGSVCDTDHIVNTQTGTHGYSFRVGLSSQNKKSEGCYTRGYFQGRGSPHSPLVELFNKLNSILVTL
jgi:hypothetical protein